MIYFFKSRKPSLPDRQVSNCRVIFDGGAFSAGKKDADDPLPGKSKLFVNYGGEGCFELRFPPPRT